MRLYVRRLARSRGDSLEGDLVYKWKEADSTIRSDQIVPPKGSQIGAPNKCTVLRV